MALLQGWSGRVGRRKLRHIWKRNKQMRLLFMTEWEPLTISRNPMGSVNFLESLAKVVKPYPRPPRLREKMITSSSSDSISSETSLYQSKETQILSTSGRAYSDLGHEVDAGKGLKTIVLDMDTSWIDFCSACGKQDALEYYHVDGSYKLCSPKCLREYVQRRKYILKTAQESIFSRKSASHLEKACWKESNDCMENNQVNEVRMREKEKSRFQKLKDTKAKWKSFLCSSVPANSKTNHENKDGNNFVAKKSISSPKKLNRVVTGSQCSFHGSNVSRNNAVDPCNCGGKREKTCFTTQNNTVPPKQTISCFNVDKSDSKHPLKSDDQLLLSVNDATSVPKVTSPSLEKSRKHAINSALRPFYKTSLPGNTGRKHIGSGSRSDTEGKLEPIGEKVKKSRLLIPLRIAFKSKKHQDKKMFS